MTGARIDCFYCGKYVTTYTDEEAADIKEDLGLADDDNVPGCCDECAKARGIPYQESAQIIQFPGAKSDI